ncbi:Pyridine nucleotide-disulfide oxidoreductase family protein [Trichomonas vaginalis G3]|uniref:Pyridine nucleotide-disulphide oxidoreductase family protein n=1 Tax=Trichomonas vaginalis (strain ATCC PRA-98 / G3) TaxID=412133 RepID=A2F960_TRIV3|nr:thioredoxin-disulfide reductase protein [Trichomonas vaginalis G3]EAX98538.1 Pyridine nucleotide-disulfide oxidoreductase family protein [Trichomonas vaginalis G3]KAI5553035.1 thioredoxin-disulfide reductase protein [Trichomonas vaginalis G3]|eukprot:XP_001311468.1 Pyridine nucleotide-disulphide oxidoreductase family protein [Trichomonas vaginalis G3]
MFSIIFFSRFSYSTDDDDDEMFVWGDISKKFQPKSIDWSKAPLYDVIILGSGPAGSTAALYSARAALKTLVFHGHLLGGQLTTTTEIENFPGFTGTGTNLVNKIQTQATAAGAIYKKESITKVNLTTSPKRIETDLGNAYLAHSIIIATGANPRFLSLKNEENFRNRGLCVCATCDGALYANKDVAVVGGGDSAVHESIYLSNICSSVKLFVRSSELRASAAMKQVLAKSTVEVIYNTEIKGYLGQQFLTAVDTKNSKTGEVKRYKLSAVFLAIGQNPATKEFEGQLELDKNKYIVLKNGAETSVKGVFAAGDVANPEYRQAIYAAGTGCQAALQAEKYISQVKAI